MRNESNDLEKYRQHLDLLWGSMVIFLDSGRQNHIFTASAILEQMNPKAFGAGFKAFILNEVENNESPF